MKQVKGLACLAFLSSMLACGGCGTVVGRLAPKDCLDQYLAWGRPHDLDTSTPVYIGARLDFTLIKGAPLTRDPVGVSLLCLIWAADMLISSIADTLLLPITHGDYPGVARDKESSFEVPSR
jgi:uncharacterized protein YceK